MGLFLVVRYLAPGQLGQVHSGPGSESPIRRVVEVGLNNQLLKKGTDRPLARASELAQDRNLQKIILLMVARNMFHMTQLSLGIGIRAGHKRKISASFKKCYWK